jgi:hypothetical protein
MLSSAGPTLPPTALAQTCGFPVIETDLGGRVRSGFPAPRRVSVAIHDLERTSMTTCVRHLVVSGSSLGSVKYTSQTGAAGS